MTRHQRVQEDNIIHDNDAIYLLTLKTDEFSSFRILVPILKCIHR